jgi:hypothetical protein
VGAALVAQQPKAGQANNPSVPIKGGSVQEEIEIGIKQGNTLIAKLAPEQHVIGSIIGSIIQLLNPAPDTIVGAQVPHGMQDNGNAHGQQAIEDIQPIGDAKHNPIVDTAPIPRPRGGHTGSKHIEDGHPTAPDETAGIAVPATPEPA